MLTVPYQMDMGDLCRENAEDILIDNQAAKEGYQPFENVKHPLEKSPELTEKVEETAPSKVENTSAPIKVENTSAPAVKQEPVLEKRPALKPVYSGKKGGRKPEKKDGGSAGSASKNQSEGASKTPNAKKKTESTPPAAKKQKTETTPPAAERKNENARAKKQKTMNTPFPAQKGKTGNSSAGKKQKAGSSSSAATKEITENTPKLRIEKAVLVAVNSRRSRRVLKPKIY